MEHSKNYDKVKMYYDTNKWSLSMLFREITNINFE